MTPDILKAGAIVIRDKKLLLTKSFGKSMYIFPGGKPEGDETLVEAVIREVREELSVGVVGEPIEYFKSPIEVAAGDPQQRTVQITGFIVELDGEPTPSAEIELMHWLSREEYEAGHLQLGSIMRDHLIPQLLEEGKM